jgi:prepilin-type processing-associated H-X9-DG protein
VVGTVNVRLTTGIALQFIQAPVLDQIHGWSACRVGEANYLLLIQTEGICMNRHHSYQLQNKKHSDSRSASVHERGITVTELLVVVSILMLVSSILFPVLASSKARAKSTTCMNQLHQYGKAVSLYISDSDDRIVPATESLYEGIIPLSEHNWNDFIQPYLKVYLSCPEVHAKLDESSAVVGYALNGHLMEAKSRYSRYYSPRDLSDVVYPSTTIGLLDAPIGVAALFNYTKRNFAPFAFYDLPNRLRKVDEASNLGRHSERSNIWFMDGHVKSLGIEQHSFHNDGTKPSFVLSDSGA